MNSVGALCELESASKRYRDVPVVSDFSLRVAGGEIVSISGPSGSGKTTILNIIGLLERADKGKLKLFGNLAPHPGSSEARRLLRYKLGYLFQNFALVDNASVAENLAIAQRYAGGRREERRTAQIEALDRVGLNVVTTRPVFELSGGEQQRLSLARLMLKPCELILADEPTGSLDARNRDEILALLRGLANEGKGVVIVTHDPKVVDMSDRNVRLRRPA